MAIVYLDSNRVTAVRDTGWPPYQQTRSGYGSKLRSAWMVQLDGKRWHRIYVVCWSNAGSAYVVERGAKLFLDSFDPALWCDCNRKPAEPHTHVGPCSTK